MWFFFSFIIIINFFMCAVGLYLPVLHVCLDNKSVHAMRCGGMVLKAEEKSMKRIWTNVHGFSR